MLYTRPPYAVVGYSYRADVYCPACAVRIVAADLGAENPDDYLPIPEDWAELAYIADVDRDDERTFDSGDFPKAIFADQVEDPEHCANCDYAL